MKRLFLLGSTGSIGTQTLDVVRWHPEEFEIIGLAANRPSDLFMEQVREFRPRYACLTGGANAEAVEGVTFLDGEEHLSQLAASSEIDVVVVASSGTVGFAPTLAALEAGKPVALANKETLIMAGHLVTRAAQKAGLELLPIDSEHSAIWQCLQGEQPYSDRVRRLILTASGGAFRDWPIEQLGGVTAEQALKHPTWSMGPKITIDSATLVNKGLEVIEAHWLFGTPINQIDVVIHHQSIIHSLVEMADGSVKAQLGIPDMRLPIQYALTHPSRLSTPTPPFNLAEIGQLTFTEVDARKYPALALAFEAGKVGGTAPTVLNAANEVAVERFLQGDISFTGISALIADALNQHSVIADPDLASVLDADRWARNLARGWRD